MNLRTSIAAVVSVAIVTVAAVLTTADQRYLSASCERLVECKFSPSVDLCVKCGQPAFKAWKQSNLNAHGGVEVDPEDLSCPTLLWGAAATGVRECVLQ